MDSEAFPQTHFFQSCRGVFEGGGCRGAAHIGAYAAAIKCGVSFAEVAGTSAGSIVAALVGAGATPDYLERTCAYLKFGEFLTKPQGTIQTPSFAKFISYGFFGKYGLLGSILRHGSGYSSAKLQEWMDDRLAELLPDASRPVKFKDLPRPTWVVATDLAGRRPKVWSTVDTPDESVALAVRCSCSIPIFFEPAELGNDLYVDGGMLSNLPSFVFADRATNPQALGGRILAFRLAGKEGYAKERGIAWLAKRLVDTAIGGATLIQRSLQSNVSTLQIKTGDVSSTDFSISKENVSFLLMSGRDTVREFIRDERSKLNDALAVDIVRYGKDELYDDLVREMAVPGKRAIVASKDTAWFWALFPSFALWMFAGAAVDLLLPAGQISARERQRRKLLSALGANIVELPEMPISCFLLSRADDRNNAAFILNESEDEYAPAGAVYIGSSHRRIIAALLEMLQGKVGFMKSSRPTLSLRLGDWNRLVPLLRVGVNQYAGPGIQIALQEVSLTDGAKPVKTIVRRVRSFKFRQIQYLASLYENASIPLFAPADIFADGVYVSTMTPPVLEDDADVLVSVEGNTRVCYLTRLGAAHFSALVVTGVTAPLPGRPVDPKNILLSTYDLPSPERIAGFSYSQFRSIEGAVRPEA